jgi:hypothetical protein
MKKQLTLPNLALAICMFFLLYFQFKGVRMLFDQGREALNFDYTLDYGEGPLLDQAVRLSNGEGIYPPDISTPPYTITNYPPLFVLLQVPFVWAAGAALWYGRLISLLCTLLAALFTGLTIHALTRDRLAALAGGLLLLVFPYVLHWAPLNRIDNLALALLMAGLYVLARNPHSRQKHVLAAFLLAGAIFTRQSYALAGPLAAVVFLLCEPSRPAGHEFDHRYGLKRTAYFILWLGGIGLVVFLILLLTSSGGFFFHIVTANVNPFFWDTVKRYAGDFKRYMPFLLAGAAGMFLWGLNEPVHLVRRLRRKSAPASQVGKAPREKANRSLDHSAWWLAAPFLVGATLSAITIGKDGSNVNYLLELCTALSLSAGVLIAWAGQESTAFKMAMLVVLALQVNGILQWSQATYATYHTNRFNQLPQLFQLNQAIQRADEGDLLADEHMAMLVTNGHNLVFQPFEFKMLSEAGKWDQSAFITSIQQKEFPLILLYDPSTWDSQQARWTPEQLSAIYANYQRKGELAETILLEPKR